MPTTDWKSRLGPLDDPTPLGWIEGMDAYVVIDLTTFLQASEEIVNPTARLFRLRSFGEPGDVEQNTKIVGAPLISGRTVAFRLNLLERGRFYRLEVLYGPVPGRRGRSVIIQVQG